LRAFIALALCGALLCAASLVARVNAAQPLQAIPLAAGSGPFSLEAAPRALVAAGSVTLADALAGKLAPQPADGVMAPLSGDQELWLPLRLRNTSSEPQTWQLHLAQPTLDEATLYEPRGHRGWRESRAGDRVAQSQWPLPGRYPRFELRFEPGEVKQLYLRVRNAVPTTLNAQLLTDADAEAQGQFSSLVFGAILGALGLLVVASLVQAALYRDTPYFLYAAYALLLGMAVAAVSGLCSQHLWGESPAWGDACKAVFPLAAASFSVWLVRELCRVSARSLRGARATALLGALVLVVAVTFGLLRTVVPVVLALGMLTAAGTVLALGAWTWRRGDPVGLWVLLAHVPLIAVTALVVLRNFGVSPFAFDSGLLTSGAILCILPLMLFALHRRNRETRPVQERVREMPSIDPLTGLLAPRMFTDRLRAAVRRYQRSRHNAAVLYVRVTNHQRIRETHGSTAAEQTMIRAAIRLQRLMPDADCLGRVSENTVGLIVETATARPVLMERASRLVAHGLMPLSDLKPEVTLNLHVVANVLSENPLDAAALQTALESTLTAMSARTRRPIRFLEPGAGRLAEADAQDDSEPDTAILA
jgi:GGDEF domain-containing protein